MSAIEKEFLEFMSRVYPSVPAGSLQFKSSRLLFYCGAFSFTASKHSGNTEAEIGKSLEDLIGALDFVKRHATNGIRLEDSLAHFVEDKEKP